MNWLCYGPDIRQARRDAYTGCARFRNARRPDTATVITTGSKAEWLSCLFESDIDIMIVEKGIMCLEVGIEPNKLPRETIVFTLNTGFCYHGHSRLNLQKRRCARIPPDFRDALCDDGNERVLLSSALYFYLYTDVSTLKGEVRHERAGPTSEFHWGIAYRRSPFFTLSVSSHTIEMGRT
ncbi:hypothetical protein DPMN_038428 [Dreissena polymorpha]|uniref:Uncharacterized protein n=2 Tax=Dreissena polymorpha TaxID=45954 RepID=A0A9D4MD37_DREPO|nr:hypothetical protein DPMN_038428 [Dreissena polymorpha]